MKISELIKELNYVLKEDGDLDISISICDVKDFVEKYPEQNYMVTTDIIPIVDEYEDKKELSLRNWRY